MKTQRKLLTAAALAAVLTLSGCWGDNEDDLPPVATTEVPDNAGISTAAFVSYLLTLGASDESSEPLTLKETFAVPANENDEPTPLT